MNKVQLSSILALVLILFLSLAVVSANDDILNINVTDTQDSVIDNSKCISDYFSSDNGIIDDGLSSDEETAGSQLLNDSEDLDSSDDLAKDSDLEDSKETSKTQDNSGKNEDSKTRLSDSSIIRITDSSYSSYFDLSKDGAIREGTIRDGDTLLIGNVSGKIFSITKNLNILPISDGDTMYNCLICLIEGSSGTSLSNLRIVNRNEKVGSFYLCGIHIINSAGHDIVNLTINNSQMKCYGIIMSNASNNRIINSTIITGQATAIPMTGSSNNLFYGNYIETYNTNMIYYCMYGNGDFYPREDLEKSHDNIIANNYFTSRNGTYDSYCYSVCLMAEAGGSGTVIANNTFNNTFRPITVSTPDTLVINNTILNVGGEAGIIVDGNNVSIMDNNISTKRLEGFQWNKEGDVVGIFTYGSNTRIIGNSIDTVGTNGIRSSGDATFISGNTINTESSACINLTKSNAVVEDNALNGIGSSAVRIYTSKLVENTTIRNNNISSDSEGIVLKGKIDYSLVCGNIIEISNPEDAIIVGKYTNRNPLVPQHYAIFNNTINGMVVNLTDISEIERNDTDSGLNNTNTSDSGNNDTGNTGINGTNVTDVNGTDINGTDVNGTNITDINGTDVNGTNITDVNGTGVNGTDINGTGNATIPVKITKLSTSITVYNTTVLRGDYLDAYLKDQYNNPVSGVSIDFHFKDKVYAKTTDSEGKASLHFDAIPDNYTMNISFTGNNYYLSSNITIDISVIPVSYYLNESNFYEYFGEDGYLKGDYEYADLIFQGDFRNKRIILNQPLRIISDSAVLYDSIIKIESDKVVVDGFTIVNRNPGNKQDNHRFAILLDYVRDVSVINNKIKLDSYDSGYGIYLSETQDSTVSNNSIDVKADKLTFGIILYDSKDNLIQDNVIKVNGTDDPHQYESTIQVDTSISVDDYEAEGMIIPEVYKTYGIILFYSSSNDIGYNVINATSGLKKYYTAVKESTNSIVGVDLYYDSNYNKVHHNNVVVSAKDPYLYGLGVLGAETGKRDQFATNNSFTDNIVFVNGTYYAAGIIAGYNSINTTILRNYIICFSNNVSYGVILEGALNSVVDSNYVISRSRINYVLEGYDTDYNLISNNTLNAFGQYVGDVNLYHSKHNYIAGNKLSPFFREGRLKDANELPGGVDFDAIFSELGVSNPLHDYSDKDWSELLKTDLTDHADVIPPHTGAFYDDGGEDNIFVDNEVPAPPSGGNGQTNRTGSGETNSNGNGNSSNGSQNSNSNSTVVNNNNGNSGSQSDMDGSGNNPETDTVKGNTVGTSSSAAVTESARAYNLDVDEDAASSRSLSFGGMNIPVLCILFLLIFACASELVKRSKRNIR